MIPLAISAASSALGLVSAIASNATSNSSATNNTGANGAATGASATGGSSATGRSAATGSANDVVNQAEFMKLLIAQLQNQDPMNPMDSANFSAQLAQFSSLEQLTQINQRLADQGQDKIGRFDAVSFIGREVTGASGAIAVKDGTATTLDYTLDTGGTVDATVTDKTGQIVATLKLEGQGSGAHQFDLAQISGAPHLDDGTYTVTLSQTDAATGTPAKIPTTVTGRVTGVDLTGSSPVLLLGDRPLDAASVTEIKEIGAASGA